MSLERGSLLVIPMSGIGNGLILVSQHCKWGLLLLLPEMLQELGKQTFV
jgi:hypothetical protein